MLWLLLQVGWAGKKHEAEAIRLKQELANLTQRNHWGGVSRTYDQLAALEEFGVVLTYDDHMLGAQASRAQGDVNATWKRLKAASKADPMATEPLDGLAQIFANFGIVRLTTHKKYEGPKELGVKDMPFVADQVRVIEACRKSLAETGSYEGLLPLGRYTFGPEKFDIIGGPDVELQLK